MPLLADNDPIVLLSKKILDVVSDHDELTILAALTAALSAAISYSTTKNKFEPAEIRALRDDLHEFFCDAVHAQRSIKTRES